MDITTRFNQATTLSGESVTAFFNGKQKTMAYDYALNAMPNHFKVAHKLLKKVDANLKLSCNNVKPTKAGYKFQVKTGEIK